MRRRLSGRRRNDIALSSPYRRLKSEKFQYHHILFSLFSFFILQTLFCRRIVINGSDMSWEEEASRRILYNFFFLFSSLQFQHFTRANMSSSLYKENFSCFFFVPHPALLSRRIQLLRSLCSASWMKSTSSNRFPTDHSHFFPSSHFHFNNMAKKSRDEKRGKGWKTIKTPYQ